jgi:hypothetical protein
MTMATPDFTAPASGPTYLDMSAPDESRTKLCVARGVLNKETGRAVTGVFTWSGKSWRTSTIQGLVTELPANISDEDLRAAYTAAVKAQRAGVR